MIFKLFNRIVVLFCFLLISTSLTFSSVLQTQNVRGTVMDGKGEPCIGATILQKGTQNGTITDANGNFSLSVPGNATLVISFIGFTTREIEVNNQRELTIQLTENLEMLSELVVVGYGVQKKVDVVGSISQVTSKELASIPQANVANMLTGAMTGLSVIQSSGEPGARDQTVVRIRGVGSFGASPNPLIIVDGIPGLLNNLNSNDIESISILKDASTASIYGARAANGVILVTTKKGAKGKTQINYDGYAGVQKPTGLMKMVDSWEYLTAREYAAGRDPGRADFVELINKYKSGSDPVAYPNIDYVDKYFNSGNGLQTAHNISASGGTDKAHYFASFGYLNQNGIVAHNNYNRYNARLSTGFKLYDNLNLLINLSGANENRLRAQEIGRKGGGYNNMSYGIFITPPIYIDQYPDGTWGLGTAGSGTVMSDLASDSRWKEALNRIYSNARLDWDVIKELKLSAIVGYNFYNQNSSDYKASMRLNPTVFHANSTLNQNVDDGVYKTAQFLANFSKEISGHTIGVLAGHSFEKDRVNFISAGRNTFASNDYNVLNMGDSGTQRNSGSFREWALLSYFGRFNYNYLGKYLLEASLRVDGSSRFPKHKRFASFPSAAAGWRISEESFFEPLKDIITHLKLKASYGVLGNQEIGNYPYQQTLASGNNQIYVFGTAIQPGAAPTTLVDPDLHWESTRTADAGFELNLLKGLFSMESNYFSRETTDILLTPTAGISNVLGMSPSQMNIGSCTNKGVELELSHQLTLGNFYYRIAGQLTYLKNEITYMGIGASPLPSGIIGSGGNYVGYPMQGFYGYLTDGVFLKNDEVANWPNQTAVIPASRAGDLRFRDINGTKDGAPTYAPDDKITTADQTYLGSRIPQYNYSATIELGYRGFDFKVMAHGLSKVSGVMRDMAGWSFVGTNAGVGTIQRWQYEGSWSLNQDNRYPLYPRLQEGANLQQNYTMSDFWVRDASFLRIKRLQLGYTIPKNLTSSVGVNSLRIYFSGENLGFLQNKYPTGWDPEQTDLDGYGYYPIEAVYTLGFNISF